MAYSMLLIADQRADSRDHVTMARTTRQEIVQIIELCIVEDGMTWTEAVRSYRNQTGESLRACLELADRWQDMQKQYKE